MAEKDIVVVGVTPSDEQLRCIWEEVRLVWPKAIRDGGIIADVHEILYYRDQRTAEEWGKLSDPNQLPTGLVHQLWFPEKNQVTFVIDTDDADAVTITQNILDRFGWKESP